MAFLNFGKRFKNRSFEFIPRYYDQEKQELEKRLRRYKSSDGDTELAKERIKGGFRKKYRVKDDYTSASQKRSNRILFATLIVLVIITYIFLTEYLPKIIATFD